MTDCFPGVITELLRDASEIPEPGMLASNPAHNWHEFDPSSNLVQAAVAYSTKHGKHPCLPGVSPLDLARLERAIAQRLPVVQVGEGVKVAPPSKQQTSGLRVSRRQCYVLKLLVLPRLLY